MRVTLNPLHNFLILVSLFTGTVLQAQDNSGEKDRSLFMSVGITPVFEMMTTRVRTYENVYDAGDLGNGYTDYDTTTGYKSDFGQTLLGVTFELRKNLYDYLDVGSVSVSAPFAASLNFYESRGRFFSLTMPVFVDANYGMHATWNNVDRYGGHIGVGYQAILGGLFSEGYANAPPALWTQLVVRAGGKFPFKKRNCFFDVYWGFGRNYKNVTYFDTYTNEFRYEDVKSKYYFKFVFGWLIHYND